MTDTEQDCAETPIDEAEPTFIHCAFCAVRFALPTALLMQREKSGYPFYCPNGQIQRLQAEVKRLEAALSVGPVIHPDTC